MSALAAYALPFSKVLRSREIVVQTAPIRAKRGFKPLTIVRIPRTTDDYADHALADLVVNAFEIVDAATQLLANGVIDDFGQFTYCAPPRAGLDAIQRLRGALQGVTPPRARVAAYAA